MINRYDLKQGHRYRASISLGLLEQIADNETIAAQIRDLGFTDVHVRGGGAARIAEGRWMRSDQLVTVSPRVTELREI